MRTTEVVAVGEELAVILPPEALRHLNVSEGDTVYVTETANGFRISRLDLPRPSTSEPHE
jgi:antitoxin component of MazEF toxin-antitoxin module